ncbi:MAG: M23 family metallopeptidase [Alphaproteobacteria bacterium]|nr:M23 family metallopeptidase [Alphaproteobacteria bacterium]
MAIPVLPEPLPGTPGRPPLPRLASPVPNPAIRGRDAKGEGHFGASRDGGRRTHLGIDLIAAPGTPVLSAIGGTVSRLGWAYGGDPHYRYVEVTAPTGLVIRHFYVAPLVKADEAVEAGRTLLGTVQDLTRRYPGITNHLHLEARQAADPELRSHRVRDFAGRVTDLYKTYPVIDPTPLLPS